MQMTYYKDYTLNLIELGKVFITQEISEIVGGAEAQK